MLDVRPCLWFDRQAEEAADFYVRLFGGRILETRRFGPGGPLPEGTVLSVTFETMGKDFMALNGGPAFDFTPAISFFVGCDGQEEVDRLWSALLDGGKPMRCGWITDRFGVSWQIVPRLLGRLLQDSDRAKAGRAMQAMMGMVKLDCAVLQRAYDGATD